MTSPKKKKQPAQTQPAQPGIESQMHPRPRYEDTTAKGAEKLTGKVALITGGDSGIGRAVAVAFAREGANIVIVYLEEQQDAEETAKRVQELGARCIMIQADVGSAATCRAVVLETIKRAGRLDILVNNAAEQHPQKDFEEITDEHIEATFRTNILAQFYLVRAALPHLSEGSAVINTTSVTAYAGHPELIDYATTKGAIVTFTRSLALNLAKRGIRVNAVAPGPIWTPLIPATFPEEKVETFGSDTPMGRAGQPDEVAPCYVFLASKDSAYMTGQVLHPNGGRIVNG